MPEINKMDQVKEKIEGADNILVALSKNPSVDEMAAAIGLTLLLDEAGKHATAIYSGATPNALEFLKPEETFETDTNSLQDFIIALNKDKADHLRYKIEGDYVRVYITPYKTEISEKDLEFSHGDFNVDLIIGLNVKNADELDAALAEYGRIMHDATAVNITAGEAGEFAEVEWNDAEASSVSEMIVKLVTTTANLSAAMSAEMATAFLTGIVAATEKFSNERTTPATMEAAAGLMKSGADQKLVADNVGLLGEKEEAPAEAPKIEKHEQDEGGALNVKHSSEGVDSAEASASDSERKEAVEKLEEMVKPAEEEPVLEQLRQVANDVKPPEFKPGQNPAQEVAPEVEEKEANNIPEMNFGGAEAVIEPPVATPEPETKEAESEVKEPVLTPAEEKKSEPVLTPPSEKKPVEDAAPSFGTKIFGTKIEPPKEMPTEPSDEVAKAVAEIIGGKAPETPAEEGELPMPKVELPPPPAPPINMDGETAPEVPTEKVEAKDEPKIVMKENPTLPEAEESSAAEESSVAEGEKEEPKSAADAMFDPSSFQIPGQNQG